MSELREQVIEAGTGKFSSWIHRFWEYRRLVVTLAARDLRTQYAQTLLGIGWSVLQPLAGLMVFTFFFGYLVKVDTGGIPYPLFAFSGMISWYYFTYLMNHGGTSLINNQELIRKVYFPKLVLPLAKVLNGFAEFGISLLLMVVLMLIYGHLPGWEILMLPFFLLLNILTGLAIALWMCALTIRFRDFHHIIPYLVHFGIWVTPVFYPTTLLPPHLSFLLWCNPMAGIITGFRWCMLGGSPPGWEYLPAFAGVLLIFVSGLILFRRSEREIADLV